jgi:hypothetical protein
MEMVQHNTDNQQSALSHSRLRVEIDHSSTQATSSLRFLCPDFSSDFAKTEDILFTPLKPDGCNTASSLRRPVLTFASGTVCDAQRGTCVFPPLCEERKGQTSAKCAARVASFS